MSDAMDRMGVNSSVEHPVDKDALVKLLREFQEVVRLLGDRADPEADPAEESVAG
jgi:hypothetical protein